MKKLLIISLIATSAAYAAENVLGLSDEIIALGGKVVTLSVEKAYTLTTEPLTGTIPKSYILLKEQGYRSFMANNPEAVARALEIGKLLSDEKSTDEYVQKAIAAFKTASSLPKDAGEKTVIGAWSDELKAYSIALINLVKQRVPADLIVHPCTSQRMLLNNGKKFDKETKTNIGAGSLAVLVGFEKRKKAMGDEAFKAFCDGQLLDSPAHHAIQSIALDSAK